MDCGFTAKSSDHPTLDFPHACVCLYFIPLFCARARHKICKASGHAPSLDGAGPHGVGRDTYENLAVSLASLFCLCSSFLIKTPILLPHKMKEYLVTDIFF